MNSQKDAYNINNYTDKELYDILDLINPSDRELEAKILHMIWKYNNFGNEDGNRLVQFYKHIYDHFFDDDEEIDTEDQDEIDTENIKEGFDNITPTNTNNNTTKPTTKSTTQPTTKPTDNVVTTTTHQLDYVKDQLNPILKQTVKRILSIDSQYREDKSSISTDFTFNLSEILKDVLSIKLFSIQVPYTWYTINANFGSNFFYIKGNSPGINNGNHDIKVSIPVGNYTADALITATNKSILDLSVNSLYTDINFGKTNISYDNASSKSNLMLDISTTYNEMYYSLYFSNWTTPNMIDASRNNSIPAFLGFNHGNMSINDPYYSFRLYSNYILPLNTSDDVKNYYTLNSTNNYFTIIQYIGSTPITEYISDPSNCTVLKTIIITLTRLTIGTTYLRSKLFDEVNYELANNSYLIPPSQIGIPQLGTSQINRVGVTNPNQIGYNYSHYELDIILNRYTVPILSNSKTAVQFPQDTNIWIGTTSAFVFNNSSYELSSIISETSSIYTNYIILSSPYILLQCTNSDFIDISNNYQINIPNSPINGELLTKYISDINVSIQNISISPLNTQNTIAFINSNNIFDLTVDFVKQFTNQNYLMDLSGTILNTLLNFTNIQQNLSLNNIFTSTFPISGSGYSILKNSYIIIINRKLTNTNPNPLTYNVLQHINENNIYPDIFSLQNAINFAFSNFTDNNGQKVLSGTTIVLIQQGNNIFATLNVIVQKNLTELDYTLEFFDPSANPIWDLNDASNSWANYLKIPKKKYILSSSTDVSFSTDVSLNTYTSDIFGSLQIHSDNLLVLDNTNNKIYIEPLIINLGNGINTGDETNSIILELQHGNYTRDTLLNQINLLFNTTLSNIGNSVNNGIVGNILAYGSHISDLSLTTTTTTVYSKIRLNVNKTYNISDYRLVFYDPYSFVTCFFGSNGVKNTTWDSTLGWILGYRQFTEYYFNSSQNIVLTGDTTVSVTIYNSFMIILNDYNQNHLNDGLITTIQRPNDIPLPSYASRSAYICDPITKKIIPPTKSNITNDNNSYTKNMTQKQIYAATENYNTQQNVNTSTTFTNKTYYSSGPFAKDVFALVPIKLAGLANNSVFVEFGGTLQQQERTYFGPVNISRLSIKLINDKGETVDLNNANWSLALVVEQLYQQKKM